MNKYITKPDGDRGLIAVECFHATIKQLTTSDSIGKLKGFKVGQGVIVVVNSLRIAELTTKDGVKHKKYLYNLIDVNGKPLGWIYAECIFPHLVVI